MTNLQLFIACVAIWGSTWIAITFQLGRVDPEASVFYRFLLASLLLFAYCLARRLPLRYSLREHSWIARQGVFMFSVSYIFVYYAEANVVSGLVAVGYSASRCWACSACGRSRHPDDAARDFARFSASPGSCSSSGRSSRACRAAGVPCWARSSPRSRVMSTGKPGRRTATRRRDWRVAVRLRHALRRALRAPWTLAGGRSLDFEPTPGVRPVARYLAISARCRLRLLPHACCSIGAARSGYTFNGADRALGISAMFESFGGTAHVARDRRLGGGETSDPAGEAC